MKIAWISSWPPRACGIATYSEELVAALQKAGNDIHIICHPDGGRPKEKNVYPVMDTQTHGWDDAVYRAVQRIDPQVIHIQHEYGLYQTDKDYASGLFRLVFRLSLEKKYSTVITYHSVYNRLNSTFRRYIDVMQRLVCAGIVHAQYQWMSLHANLGHFVDNVYVIPHGAENGVLISGTKAKKKLGLEGLRVMGMLGWFTPTKGFDAVFEVWDDIASHLGEKVMLVLAGDARRGDPNQIDYKKKLLSLVEKSSHKDQINVILGSFTPEEYRTIMAAFDLMLMPYTFGSQSGNLAHSFSLGVPAVVSDMEGLKAEAEASGAALTVPPGDREALKRTILMLMENELLRKQYARRAKAYVNKKIGWSIIAKKHMQVYKKAIRYKKQSERDYMNDAFL